MKIETISTRLSVCPQIQVADVGNLRKLGFAAIINNRPDGESDDQPTSEELAREAERHGLVYAHIPVIPGQIDPKHVQAFVHAQQSIDGPVLAFCRSGMRATQLWAMSRDQQLGIGQ